MQPPGPPLPRWIQTLGFLFDAPRFMDASRRRYGDVVSFSTLFDRYFVVVFDPATLARLFRGSPEHLRAGEANAVLGPLVGERSLLLLDGAEHLRHRRLLLPPFHGERMRAHEATMREATDRVVDEWRPGRDFTLLPAMQAITLDVILRAVFGVQDEARRGELHRAIRALLDPVGGRRQVLLMVLSGGRLGGAAQRSFVQRRAAVGRLIRAEIADRRAACDVAERDDVLSQLLRARVEDAGSSPAANSHGDRRPAIPALGDDELHDELLTLLVAGHETTATALAWMLERLLATPPVLERLRASLAAGERDYLDATVKEALRARPVVAGIGRTVRGEAQDVGGYLVEPGTEINPSLAAIHRRGDVHPQPRAFRPERFLAGDGTESGTWVPFGGGTRRCPGASFATFEMGVVVRRILERADLRPAGRRPERPVRKGVVFVPRDGVRVRMAGPVRPRSVPA